MRYGETYGRPLTDTGGYVLKLKDFVPQGLAATYPRGDKSPGVTLTDVFVTPVAMCKPPRKKPGDAAIDTVIGRKAVECCAPSLRVVLRGLLAENPNRMLVWQGASALAFSQNKLGVTPPGKKRKKAAIGPWRGRPVEPTTKALDRLNAALAEVPPHEVIKFALRGVKVDRKIFPKEFEMVLRAVLATQRRGVRKPPQPPVEFTPHNMIVKLLISRQRAAMKRKEKSSGKTCEKV